MQVGNADVPLQLYADESYVLTIPATAGYITIDAPTRLNYCCDDTNAFFLLLYYKQAKV